MRSLRSPEVMFEVAAEADLIWELSRLCRSRAIEGMRHAPAARTSCSSSTSIRTTSPTRRSTSIESRRAASASSSRSPSARRSRTIRSSASGCSAFRERGYRFAVDDAGSGYAGLGSIANLEPDFIKLDMSLINCIDTNFIKQNLVETMVRFANDQGAKVIAEGVERAEEFETVKGLGVHLVQGFFLHRPSHMPLTRAARNAATSAARASAQQAIDQLERPLAPRQSRCAPARARSRPLRAARGASSSSSRTRRASSRIASSRRHRRPRREQRRHRGSIVVARAEQHRRAERRRLEHRVQSRRVEAAADERDVASA